MFQTFKTKLTLAMAALLLLGGGTLMSGIHPAAAQDGPPPTEVCTAQDAAATAEAPESDSAVDTGNTDFQCGDQNAPDTNAETESSVEPVEAANDKGGDNIDQQGDHQDTGDTQPDGASSSQ